jgi:CDP-glucose 4,6-dehydratase
LAPPTNPSLYELAHVDALVRSRLGDVRDLEHLAAAVGSFSPEVILHLVAQSVVLDSYSDPVNTYSTNVMGTVNMLESTRRLGRQTTVVNVTTDKCYRNQGWPWGYRENDPLGGRDPYSNSKACAELVAQAYRDTFFPRHAIDTHGVSVVCARAGNVIGGGDWTPHQLIPATVAAFARGESVTLRYPKAIRPWQHVLDCLDGYLVLAEAAARSPGKCDDDWNFGPSGDDVFSVADVVEVFANRWGIASAWQQASGAIPHEELELRLDCSKARRLLGWRSRLSVRHGIEWAADWYLGLQSGTAARDACMSQIDAYLGLFSGSDQ